MHFRSNTRTRSPDIVRGMITSIILLASLSYCAGARAIEPKPISIELLPPPEKTSEQIVEGGVVATMLFSTFGLGMGLVATAIDVESERKRSDPCRSCPGGFNDMQRDMAMIANGSLFSFIAAGILGAATTAYAAATHDERIEAPKKKKETVKIRACAGGFVVSF